MEDLVARAISRDPLIRVAARSARASGATAFLVGGAVRDILLGRAPDDLDLACARAGEAAKDAAARLGTRSIAMGRGRFRCWRVPAGHRHLDWAPLAPGGIEADLMRRDFSIDAMAVNLETNRLLDPAGGIRDLEDRILRMTSPKALREDPLRILRAYRLLGLLEGFRMDGATEGAASRSASGLKRMAPERVNHELQILLASERPGVLVRRMDAGRVLSAILPELEPMRGLGQNLYHHADALEHTLEALEALDGPPAWLPEVGFAAAGPQALVVLRLAALLHDSGKPATRTADQGGSVHFYGHPKISADIARSTLRRLRFPRDTQEAVAALCLNHLRPLGLVKSGGGHTALRRLVHDLGPLLPHLLVLSLADKSASRGPGHEQNLEDLRALAARVLEVARGEGEDLRRLPKLVSGLEALEVLGMARPGPDLGRALDALMERQVAGAVASREEAVEFLRRYRERHLP